ncbi:MAG TPA: acetylglutamate kinase [Chloroflexota bacterium]|jgi:acetylglutamate kinase|nr:acetylglutamate kinase [Chloroflexota bacterium]
MSLDIAGVLQEALPYINYFVGKTVVVKMGGSALSAEHTVLQDVIWLKNLQVNVVLVHGGGDDISNWLKRIGKDSKTVKGLRVTDDETMEVVKMVLVGKVQQELVAAINGLGGEAVGISGLDGKLFECERYTGEGDLGLVGRIKRVNLRPVTAALNEGYIPVVTPVGFGEGGVTYNINADLGAGELAASLRAEKLIFLTDVIGICDTQGQLISELNVNQVPELVDSGILTGGMLPKVEAAGRALERVKRVHIIDGRVPHALVREMFTDKGVGTMVVRS